MLTLCVQVILCSGNIEGIEELRRTIQEAKEKYKKELGN